VKGSEPHQFDFGLAVFLNAFFGFKAILKKETGEKMP
jgi:hypothetical protein